jgi:hypothetical protein
MGQAFIGMEYNQGLTLFQKHLTNTFSTISPSNSSNQTNLDNFLTFSGIQVCYASKWAGLSETPEGKNMNDLIYLVYMAVFFALTFGLLRLCDILMGGTK